MKAATIKDIALGQSRALVGLNSTLGLDESDGRSAAMAVHIGISVMSSMPANDALAMIDERAVELQRYVSESQMVDVS